MKTTLFLTLILSIFGITGCRTASSEKVSDKAAPSVESQQQEIKQVSVAEAKTAIDEKKDAQFIDVRTVEEYDSGHAPKAVNMPLDSLENNLAKLDQDKPVYVICQTGRRSQKGSEILQKSGFKDIYNIKGGTSEWISAGLPTEK